MVTLILLVVPLVVMLCVRAFGLATFALRSMLAFEAARFAYAAGAGWIGVGIVGFFAGVASLGILTLLFTMLRAPILRITVAVIFAAPAAVAGYALVHGIAREDLVQKRPLARVGDRDLPIAAALGQDGFSAR